MMAIKKLLLYLSLAALACLGLGCAPMGHVTREYDQSFYQVPKLLPDSLSQAGNRFIFYGDSRQGWRLEEKLLKRKNWLTWKMALVPFYQAYLFGNIGLGGFNYLRAVPDYGTPERKMVRDAIYAAAKQSSIAFVIHNGDMVTDGRRPQHWANFIRENKFDLPILAEVPFLPTAGNHEQINDTRFGKPNYQAVFSYPQFYQLDLENASLFFVNSDLIIDLDQQIPDADQDSLFNHWFVAEEASTTPAWLETRLAASQKTFKIVVMHYPPVSFNHHHSNWNESKNGPNLPEKHRCLLQLFTEQNVQLVLSGHEHVFELSVIDRIQSNPIAEPGIYQLTSGGGGVPLREKSTVKTIKRYIENYQDQGLAVRLLQQDKIYHFCVLTIEPDYIDIQVVQVTGRAQEPTRVATTMRIPAR